MSTLDSLRQMQDEFTHRCGRCVIAGGAVRDVLLGREPKDYDVFVFNEGKPIDKSVFDGLQIVESPEWHKSEPRLQVTLAYGDAIVQVMSSECKSLTDLVATFDWNVSAFGYDQHSTPNVLEVGKLADIGPNKTLKLLKVTYPVSSLRRGFRFSERYCMKFDAVDLQSLCTMAAGRLAEIEWGVQK